MVANICDMPAKSNSTINFPELSQSLVAATLSAHGWLFIAMAAYQIETIYLGSKTSPQFSSLHPSYNRKNLKFGYCRSAVALFKTSQWVRQ